MKNVKVSEKKLLTWALAQLDKKTREAIRDARKDNETRMREHYADEAQLLGAFWMKEKFTKRELEKLAGMSYKKILSAYRARNVESIRKESGKTAEDIRAICAAPMPAFIDVVVEWKKNRIWGANPRAELRTGENYYISGSIGGCGYDKESTATAQVFNLDAGMKKAALVALYVDAHRPKNKRHLYGVDFFWCSGPRFSSGCGFSSHRSALELAGYKLVNQNGGKMFNTYYFA